jgi:hypothetical protein
VCSFERLRGEDLTEGVGIAALLAGVLLRCAGVCVCVCVFLCRCVGVQEHALTVVVSPGHMIHTKAWLVKRGSCHVEPACDRYCHVTDIAGM